ncbi:uncharacterized protein LOC144344439 [Saccoglossus kowalevskii]
MNKYRTKANRKMLAEQNQQELAEYAKLREKEKSHNTTYDKQFAEMNACPRGEYHKNKDPARRKAFMEATEGDYSAKIPNRYSSINYSQQW